MQYVSDVEQARQVVAELMAEPVVGLDIKKTGLDPLLDKIRLVQLACPSAAYVIDAYHVPTDVLTPLLNGGPIKVAHKAKFDAGFLYEAPGGVMPEPLYDTMLADQVAHGRSYGRSLEDLAEDYLTRLSSRQADGPAARSEERFCGRNQDGPVEVLPHYASVPRGMQPHERREDRRPV